MPGFLQVSRYVFLLGLFGLLCRLATAQATLAHSAYYSVDDGLSSREVHAIFQDDLGFIWVGTDNGLNRFDGYQFETFNNLPNTKFKISDNEISHIGQAKNGQLFIEYRNTPLFFDLLDLNTLTKKKIDLLPDNGLMGIPQSIHLGYDGEIYVLAFSEGTTHIYQYMGEDHFQPVCEFDNTRQKRTSPVSFTLTLEDHFLINDSETGLLLVSRQGQVLQRFSARQLGLNEEGTNRYPGGTRIFHQDQQGRIWLSFEKTPGLISLIPHAPVGYRVNRPDFVSQQRYYTRLWEDQQGNLLIAEPVNIRNAAPIRSLLCLKADGAALDFSHITTPRQQTTTIYSANFFGTIFFGLDTGFKIVENNQSSVKTFLKEDIPEDQRGVIMRGMTGNGQDKIYIAREDNGWHVLDLTTDFLDTLQIVDREGRPIPLIGSMNLHLDKRGYLWGFTRDDGGEGLLLKYDTANCHAEIFPYPRWFSHMAPTPDGQFWLTVYSKDSQGELVLFDPRENRFQPYRDQKGRNPLSSIRPYYLLYSSTELLYIGTDQGLYVMDPTTNTFSAYQREGGAADYSEGLRSDDILVIHEAEDGTIWLGTTNGLSILAPSSGQILTLDKEDGLPSNIVCGILPDGRGNYWISTYNGLSFYAPEYDIFRKFYSTDGFSHNEFNRFSFYRDHRGRFYFGGVNGINAFYPKDLIIATSPPSPQLTRITRFSTLSDSLHRQKTRLHSLQKLEIKPYDSYFQVHFMLPVFSRTDKNQFSAWLEGYEPGWTNLGNSPFVRYNNLPPGRYTLHINGSDPNGNPSQTPISLDIQVYPKFYTTWWFILCCIAAAIALGYALFRYQLDQQLRVERLRTKLSSDIHDEVSGLLSGIAMQADVLREQSSDGYIQQKLESIGETSRKAMSKMSDIIWSTDSRKDRMSDLVERMQEHADEILLKVNIPYDFQVKKIDQNRKIPVQIRQNLYFIYKEAINNISKHADANRVNIQLANRGNNFQMIIYNDGRAKKNGRRKGGQGISNIKMRAHRIKANVDIYNHDGFTVKVSMKKFV